jgi:hypothetical protein
VPGCPLLRRVWEGKRTSATATVPASLPPGNPEPFCRRQLKRDGRKSPVAPEKTSLIEHILSSEYQDCICWIISAHFLGVFAYSVSCQPLLGTGHPPALSARTIGRATWLASRSAKRHDAPRQTGPVLRRRGEGKGPARWAAGYACAAWSESQVSPTNSQKVPGKIPQMEPTKTGVLYFAIYGRFFFRGRFRYLLRLKLRRYRTACTVRRKPECEPCG